MKIGILASGTDTLALFSFLQKHDHDYVVWYDDLFSFWGDMPLAAVLDRVQVGMDFLKTKGVEWVILPPLVELMLAENSQWAKIPVLPLFRSYLMKFCFSHSLVGKIGYFGDRLDMQYGQDILKKLALEYDLTPNQRAIRKFQIPFAWRGKEVRNWKYLLASFSWSAPLVNTLIKNDLRYFKDAGVDTLIPLNYGYFHVEKTIKKTLNFKQMRFHGMSDIETCFGSLIETCLEKTSYSVVVYFTGHGQFLRREKRLMWLLGRGNMESISLLSCLS